MYKVINDTSLFKVVEEETQQVVFVSNKEKNARNICRDLNLGSGFGGWTPTFFCQDFKLSA
jgi:hypothetical protein